MKSFIRKIIVLILTLESRLVIAKYRPFVITVTGSVGKTSTKDAIWSVLTAGSDDIRRSEKSFNSEFGVPLTILGCENAWGNIFGWIGNIMHGLELIFFRSEYPSTLILEVGADHPGDIRRIARWLRPNIVVVTKIGTVPVHIEFFPSREALVAEKLSFVRTVRGSMKKGWKVPGIVILPADDNEIIDSARAILKERSVNIMTYAVDPIVGATADVSATQVETIYEVGKPIGITYKLNYGGNSMPMKQLGVLGIQHVYPALAAVAVGVSRGLSVSTVADAVASHRSPPGRMNILAGLNDSTIIDDSYNASPDAVREALTVLGSLDTSGASGISGRKIAVLGDMMELGKFSREEHQKIGSIVAGALGSSGVLVTVGQRAEMICQGAIEAGMKANHIHSHDTSLAVAGEIVKYIKKGDLILVKGSQSPRMERVVKALMAEPEKASELLVRQDEEWLKR